MDNVRSGDHLEQIGETWYYRRTVPADVRNAFGGKTKVKFSLKTKSYTQAKRLEKAPDAEFEERLAAARGKRPDGLPRDPELRAKQIATALFPPLLNNEIDFDTALDQVPETDRSLVHKKLRNEMAEFRNHLKENTDWQQVMRQVIDHKIGYDTFFPEVMGGYQNRAENIHTLDWALEFWLKAKNRPQQTQDDGRRYLEEFKSFARVRALAAVRRRHITDWRAELQAAGTLSAKSINHRLEIVSAILRTGWREAEIPALDLKFVNLPEPVTSGRGSWTRDELLKALAALEPHSWSAWLFVIALTTGTRLGEPVAARKEWFDALGFINAPAEFTKMKKPHAMPIIGLIRGSLIAHIARLPDGAFMFDAPRPGPPPPGKKPLKISHEASKWFGRFFHRKDIKIDKVFHELRHTWVEAARISPIKKEVHDIISGHAGTTVSDRYGGCPPSELMDANEVVCAKFLDAEMTAAIKRLIG